MSNANAGDAGRHWQTLSETAELPGLLSAGRVPHANAGHIVHWLDVGANPQPKSVKDLTHRECDSGWAGISKWWRFRLRVQGKLAFKLVLCIVTPLIVQLALLSYLAVLLNGAERLSRAEVHSRDVTNKLDSIGHLVALKAVATLQYAITKDPDYSKIAMSSAAAVPAEIQALKGLCSEDQTDPKDLVELSDVALNLAAVCDGALGHAGKPDIERLQCPTVKEKWQRFYRVRERLMQEEKVRHDHIMSVLPQAKDQVKDYIYVCVGFNLIIAVLTISLLAGSIVRRINKLTRNAISLSEGKSINENPSRGTDELAILDQSFHKMARALHEALEQESKLARIDTLSQLPNRFSFSEKVLCPVSVKRDNQNTCIVICDIDKFKSINDRYGHAVGDEAIKHTASCIRNTVRDSDVTARWGGEEFIICLPNSDLTGATTLAERLRAAVCDLQLSGGDSYFNFTISCGVAEKLADEDIEVTIQRADAALYRAKNDGRNRTVIALTDERLPVTSGVMSALGS